MKEEKIIKLLKDKFRYRDIVQGIGDDAAVLPYTQKEYLLFTTDTILEGIHFQLNKVKPRDVGYKAMAVNISDIAAMGGVPLYGVVNLGLPDYSLEKVNQIYKGIDKISRSFDIKIVGGDTIKSKNLFLAVALIGKVEKKNLITRSGAKAGDLICVTGEIGGAISSGKHYKFTPRLKEARWIVKNLKPTAMIDISDGLVLDLSRLCQASKKGALIYKNKIPVKKGVDFQSALSQGEDFELLFTLSPEAKVRDISEVSISFIGEIRSEKGIYLQERGKIVKQRVKGYDHFT